MKKQMKRRLLALTLAAGMLLAAAPVTAEETAAPAIADAQTLDSSYTLALAAINSEDYETAKEYLDICFVYCSPQNNPQLYADLLLKRACINVIEEKNTMALLNLEAALRLQPELAEAFLVRTQIYTASGEFDKAVTDLEKYIVISRFAKSITSSSIRTPFVVRVKRKFFPRSPSTERAYATSCFTTSKLRSGSPPKKSTSRFLRLPEFSIRKSSARRPTS